MQGQLHGAVERVSSRGQDGGCRKKKVPLHSLYSAFLREWSWGWQRETTMCPLAAGRRHQVLVGILQPSSCCLLNPFWQSPSKGVVSSSPILNNVINFRICYCRALVHVFAAGCKGNSSLSLKALVVMAKVGFTVSV